MLLSIWENFFTSSHQSTIDLIWPLVSLFVIAALSTWGQFCQSPRLILFASDYYFWIWKKNHIQNLSCWVLSNDNRNDNEDNNDIDDNSDKNDDTMTTTVTTKVTTTTKTTKVPNRYLYLKFKYFFQKIWFILYFLVLMWELTSETLVTHLSPL